MSVSKAIIRRGVPIRALTYVLLLAISLMALGTVGAFFNVSFANSLDILRREDLPSSSTLRIISRESGHMRRSLEGLDIMKSAEDIDVIRARVAEFRAMNDENMKELHVVLSGEDAMKLLNELTEVRRAYLNEMDVVLGIAAREGTSPNYWLAKQKMLAASDVYREKRDEMAEFCEKRADDRSAEIVERVRRFEYFCLFLALWPALVGLMLFVYGIVSTALLFFRERS